MRALILIFTLILLALSPLKAIALPDNCIVINVPSRTLDLYVDGKIKKTYPVGVGRPDFPTPTGDFKVIRKVVKPGWENPYKPAGFSRIHAGNTNPLGTRWIGFNSDPSGEYGIHGTDNPTSVGKFSSHGCVRMYIKDAEELFDSIKLGTPVLVTYHTVRVSLEDSKVFMSIYPDTYKKGMMTINKLREVINNLDFNILWNASIALEAMNVKKDSPVKIGTVIDENDFY